MVRLPPRSPLSPYTTLFRSDELVQLLDDLLERCGLHVHHDGDPADPLVVRRGDGQAEYVVAPPGEQAGHPGQHPRLVLHQDGEGVVALVGSVHAHQRSPQVWLGSTMMSSLEAPAATIGKTFSKASVRKSMTTGRSSMSLALSMAESTSSVESTRMPTHPIDSAQPT